MRVSTYLTCASRSLCCFCQLVSILIDSTMKGCALSFLISTACHWADTASSYHRCMTMSWKVLVKTQVCPHAALREVPSSKIDNFYVESFCFCIETLVVPIDGDISHEINRS